jgi:putative transcriptional regulator
MLSCTIKTLIRWKLNEVMARHRVKGKDLAEYLGVSANAISGLRKASIMPEIGGQRWEYICLGINKLSKIGEIISPLDLIEYIPDEEIPTNRESVKDVPGNKGANSLSKSMSGDSNSFHATHHLREEGVA